jgi:hypothetical protein
VGPWRAPDEFSRQDDPTGNSTMLARLIDFFLKN